MERVRARGRDRTAEPGAGVTGADVVWLAALCSVLLAVFGLFALGIYLLDTQDDS